MTTGHKHWIIASVRRDGLALRMLQGVTVWRCKDVEKVDRSRFPYTGKTPNDIEPDENGYWRLSLLGFLHGLTGATVKVKPPKEDA